MRRPLSCVVAAAIVCSASAGLAQPEAAPHGTDEARAAARDIAKQGDAEFAAGRCTRAIAHWQRADAKFHAPTIVLRIARCQALVGHVVEATKSLESIVAEQLPSDAPTPFLDARAQAESELPGVRARIATLGIAVWSPRGTAVEPAIELDRAAQPRGKRSFQVDPGIHFVRVRAADAAWEGTLTLDEGEARALRVSLRTEEAAGRSRVQRNVGLVVGGVGLAGLGVGAGLGISALATGSDLDTACGASRNLCPRAEQSTIDDLKTRSWAADITLGVGALLTLTGGLIVLLEPAPNAPRVKLTPVGGAPAAGGL